MATAFLTFNDVHFPVANETFQSLESPQLFEDLEEDASAPQPFSRYPSHGGRTLPTDESLTFVERIDADAKARYLFRFCSDTFRQISPVESFKGDSFRKIKSAPCPKTPTSAQLSSNSYLGFDDLCSPWTSPESEVTDMLKNENEALRLRIEDSEKKMSEAQMENESRRKQMENELSELTLKIGQLSYKAYAHEEQIKIRDDDIATLRCELKKNDEHCQQLVVDLNCKEVLLLELNDKHLALEVKLEEQHASQQSKIGQIEMLQRHEIEGLQLKHKAEISQMQVRQQTLVADSLNLQLEISSSYTNNLNRSREMEESYTQEIHELKRKLAHNSYDLHTMRTMKRNLRATKIELHDRENKLKELSQKNLVNNIGVEKLQELLKKRNRENSCLKEQTQVLSLNQMPNVPPYYRKDFQCETQISERVRKLVELQEHFKKIQEKMKSSAETAKQQIGVLQNLGEELKTESEQCLYCCDAVADHVLCCGHLMCLGCWSKLSGPKRCPVCRNPAMTRPTKCKFGAK